MVRGVVWGLVGAALTFVGVSALMNAVFLASLGRTRIEAALLAGVSLGADLAKLVLPVVIVHAWRGAQWSRVLSASAMLLVTVMLSVTSGVGFAATVRDGSAAAHDAQRSLHDRLLRDLAGIEARLLPLAAAGEADVLQREIATAESDRSFTASVSCTLPKGPAARSHCATLRALRVAHAQAEARDGLLRQRESVRRELAGLDGAGAVGDSDAQVTALAGMLALSRESLKVGLAVAIAITLEIGGLLLVGLAAAVSMRQETPSVLVVPRAVSDAASSGPEKQASAVRVPVELPMIADRVFWQKQRAAIVSAGAGQGRCTP